MSSPRIEPTCLPGYAVIAEGLGRIERTAEGIRHGVPEPVLGACARDGGVCWWVKAIGWTSSQPLSARKIRAFFLQP